MSKSKNELLLAEIDSLKRQCAAEKASNDEIKRMMQKNALQNSEDYRKMKQLEEQISSQNAQISQLTAQLSQFDFLSHMSYEFSDDQKQKILNCLQEPQADPEQEGEQSQKKDYKAVAQLKRQLRAQQQEIDELRQKNELLEQKLLETDPSDHVQLEQIQRMSTIHPQFVTEQPEIAPENISEIDKPAVIIHEQEKHDIDVQTDFVEVQTDQHVDLHPIAQQKTVEQLQQPIQTSSESEAQNLFLQNQRLVFRIVDLQNQLKNLELSQIPNQHKLEELRNLLNSKNLQIQQLQQLKIVTPQKKQPKSPQINFKQIISPPKSQIDFHLQLKDLIQKNKDQFDEIFLMKQNFTKQKSVEQKMEQKVQVMERQLQSARKLLNFVWKNRFEVLEFGRQKELEGIFVGVYGEDSEVNLVFKRFEEICQ